MGNSHQFVYALILSQYTHQRIIIEMFLIANYNWLCMVDTDGISTTTTTLTTGTPMILDRPAAVNLFSASHPPESSGSMNKGGWIYHRIVFSIVL